MVMDMVYRQIPGKSEAALMAAQFVDKFPGCSGEGEGAHHGDNTLVSKHTEVTKMR